jgi:hypothetical protein
VAGESVWQRAPRVTSPVVTALRGVVKRQFAVAM